MVEATGYNDAQWHLDKRVPLALIVAIFLQSVSAVWWAATIHAKVTVIETYTSEDRDKLNALGAKVEVGARVDAVITEQLRATASNIEHLRAEVEKTNGLLREMLRATTFTP